MKVYDDDKAEQYQST